MSKSKTAEVVDLLSDLPPEHETEEVYQKFLSTFQQRFTIWDRGKGWMSWVQGTVLNRIANSSRCGRQSIQRITDAVGIGRATAYNCRRIAQRFNPDEARTMGYTEMLTETGWKSFAKTTTKSKSKTQKVTANNLVDVLKKAWTTINQVPNIGKSKKERDDAAKDYRVAISHLKKIKRDADKAIAMLDSRINESIDEGLKNAA